MGDKNPKKQKKKKRILEKPSMTPMDEEQAADKGQSSKPQKKSRGK